MVKAAPEIQPAEPELVDISPTRGGGHGGHALGFFTATQLAPFVSMVLALAFVAGGVGSTGWMWLAVAAVAVPAAALFVLAVFLAEHGFE